MFCKMCGKEILDESVVCPECGCLIQGDAVASEAQQKKKSRTSTVLGIIGIVIAWFFALAGHIVSVIGIVTGIKEYKETGKITGLALSIIGEVCAIFSSIVGAAAFSSLL